MATDVDGPIVSRHRKQGRSGQPRRDTLAPLNFNLIHAVASENFEIFLGYLVRSFNRSGAGMDGNPDDDRTECPLFNVFTIGDSKEAGGADGIALLSRWRRRGRQ